MDDEVCRQLHKSSSSPLASSSHTCEKCMYLCDHTWPRIGIQIMWKVCIVMVIEWRCCLIWPTTNYNSIGNIYLEWRSPINFSLPKLPKTFISLSSMQRATSSASITSALLLSSFHKSNLSCPLAFNEHLAWHSFFEPCLQFVCCRIRALDISVLANNIDPKLEVQARGPVHLPHSQIIEKSFPFAYITFTVWYKTIAHNSG